MSNQPRSPSAGIFRGPVFVACCVAIAGVGLATVWQLQRDVGSFSVARRMLDQQRRKLRQLEAVSPQPTAEIGRQIEADLEHANNRLIALQAIFALPPSEITSTEMDSAATRAGDYFTLAAFVARMRDEAARFQVWVPPGEYFGFADYASAGPPTYIRELVLHESRHAERLLRVLYASHPARLESFIRGLATDSDAWGNSRIEVIGSAQAARIPPTGTQSSPPDDQRRSTRFRLVFTAETSALRRFLNTLAEVGSTLIVRSVNVQPAEPVQVSDPARLKPMTADPAIRHGLSRFTVVVEIMTLTTASAPTA